MFRFINTSMWRRRNLLGLAEACQRQGMSVEEIMVRWIVSPVLIFAICFQLKKANKQKRYGYNVSGNLYHITSSRVTRDHLIDSRMAQVTASLLLGWRKCAASLPGSQRACHAFGVEVASPSAILLPATRLRSWQQLVYGIVFLAEQLITMADVGSRVPQPCSCLCVRLDFLKELISFQDLMLRATNIIGLRGKLGGVCTGCCTDVAWRQNGS